MHKNNSNLTSDETFGDVPNNRGKAVWQAPALNQLAAQNTEAGSGKPLFSAVEVSTFTGS